MGTEQIEVRGRFDPGFSVRCKTDNMCEHILIRILPRLFSAVISGSLCKHIPVRREDLSPDHLLCKKILSLIIRAVDEDLALRHLKINKISHHTYKKHEKRICNNRKLPVLLTRCLRCPLFRILFSFFLSSCNF